MQFIKMTIRVSCRELVLSESHFHHEAIHTDAFLFIQMLVLSVE